MICGHTEAMIILIACIDNALISGEARVTICTRVMGMCVSEYEGK